MMILVAGLAIFIAIHLFPTNRELRAGLHARYGEAGYKGIFSVVALLGLVLIIVGYGTTQQYLGSKNPILWDPPVWTRHVSFLLMLPSMIFLVAAYIPSRIRAALKHPMLLAVKIWALAHLLANGDAASLILFGSFLAWAVYDRISLKKRGDTGWGGATGSILNDVAVVAVGTALWGFMLVYGHALLIGVPLVSI
ncbi:MAG: NnrU family protein [Hyphomicrobiaceae bacterium]|nr:NnrU family protein [Hyphomicrobiaceae bacterium]